MKLPDSYYRYAAEELDESKKSIRDRISIRLPRNLAIELEKEALEKEIKATDILRKILIDEGVLDPGDVAFCGRKKNLSRYLDKIDIGFDLPKRKIFHLPINRYAKIKIYHYLIKENMTVSQFFQKILAKQKQRS